MGLVSPGGSTPRLPAFSWVKGSHCGYGASECCSTYSSGPNAEVRVEMKNDNEGVLAVSSRSASPAYLGSLSTWNCCAFGPDKYPAFRAPYPTSAQCSPSIHSKLCFRVPRDHWVLKSSPANVGRPTASASRTTPWSRSRILSSPYGTSWTAKLSLIAASQALATA